MNYLELRKQLLSRNTLKNVNNMITLVNSYNDSILPSLNEEKRKELDMLAPNYNNKVYTNSYFETIALMSGVKTPLIEQYKNIVMRLTYAAFLNQEIEEEELLRTKSAIKIQSRFRGMRVRKPENQAAIKENARKAAEKRAEEEAEARASAAGYNLFDRKAVKLSGGAESTSPSSNTYRDKYLKYDQTEGLDPSLDIWQAKYLKYKAKYNDLKNKNKN